MDYGRASPGVGVAASHPDARRREISRLFLHALQKCFSDTLQRPQASGEDVPPDVLWLSCKQLDGEAYFAGGHVRLGALDLAGGVGAGRLGPLPFVGVFEGKQLGGHDPEKLRIVCTDRDVVGAALVLEAHVAVGVDFAFEAFGAEEVEVEFLELGFGELCSGNGWQKDRTRGEQQEKNAKQFELEHGTLFLNWKMRLSIRGRSVSSVPAF